MKTVLITGCSSGLGYYLAVEFLKKGYKVYVTSRDTSSLKNLAKLGATILELNLLDSNSINNAVNKITTLDILINNAGYAQIGPMLDLSDDELLNQFRVNLFSPIKLIQILTPILKKSQNAKIVNIGSMSGIMATPLAGSYCSSKAGINILTDVLRMELSIHNIKVIKVLPGVFKSSFGHNAENSINLRPSSNYPNLHKTLVKRAQASQKIATPTKKVANILARKIDKKHTQSTILVAKGAIAALFTSIFIPTFIKDFIFKRSFNLQ